MTASDPAEAYIPTHRDLRVDFAPGDFQSSLKTLKSWKIGEVITPLTGLTKAPKAYSSVQCGPGPNDHVELNSDLLYINHSCEPNIAFDLSSQDMSQWHIRALKDISAREALTFFYPSTEWEMGQAFDCKCGAPSCLRTIQGAKFLKKEDIVVRGYVSPWISDLVSARDRSESPQSRL